MKLILRIVFLYSTFTFCTNAALIERLDGLAYYDDVLDITWLADANFAATESFGVNGISSYQYPSLELGGGMSWAIAQDWVAAMNATNGSQGYLGHNQWRLPSADPVNGSTYDYTFFVKDGSTDSAFNISAPGSVYEGSTQSELAHLYYNTLLNSALYDIDGTQNNCDINPLELTGCLTNTGPFSNLLAVSNVYWTGNEATSDTALGFTMQTGQQYNEYQSATGYVLAVADGDVFVSEVPVPAALWLFSFGLLTLFGVLRKP
ncbi:MAG TPA: hypothetical protein VIQ81_08570 [Gammaproteobacteria bacterium]